MSYQNHVKQILATLRRNPCTFKQLRKEMVAWEKDGRYYPSTLDRRLEGLADKGWIIRRQETTSITEEGRAALSDLELAERETNLDCMIAEGTTLMSVSEAADALGVSSTTLKTWIAGGAVEARKIGENKNEKRSGTWVVDARDLAGVRSTKSSRGRVKGQKYPKKAEDTDTIQ